MNHQHQFDLLEKLLVQLLGEIDGALLDAINSEVEWVFLRGNQVLFERGQESEAVYIVLTGRLKAFLEDDEGRRKLLGDIVRGETVGELPMFTGEPRSADVIAARDSTLARLSKEAFIKLLSKDTAFSINITRLIINRFNNKAFQKDRRPPVSICLVPAHSTVDAGRLAQQLQTSIAGFGSSFIVSSAIVDQHFNKENFAQTSDSLVGLADDVTRWLDELEAGYDFLVYVADYENNAWTNRCRRQSDQIVVLADTTQPCAAGDIETSGVEHSAMKTALALIHPPDTFMPSGTDRWLDARPWLDAHYHLRQNNAEDMQRLGRIISGNATGFVLAGGGAKGFAHIGVYQALREHGISVDFVGGTSVGATVAAAIAMTQPEHLKRNLRKAAFLNPTKDLALVPFLALMTGKRARRMIAGAIQDFTGREDILIEDLWLPMYAISSNFTQAKEEVHRRGSLKKTLLASIAIPGVFPPIISGNDLLVDGATFNNFPVDVMRDTGVKNLIGCDLVVDKKYHLKITETPSTRQFLIDKLKPKKKRKYRLPSLTSILINATVLYSYSKRRENAKMLDLCFNPDLSRYGMTNWKAYDKIVETGYTHAHEVLAQLPAERMAKLKEGRSTSVEHRMTV